MKLGWLLPVLAVLAGCVAPSPTQVRETSERTLWPSSGERGEFDVGLEPGTRVLDTRMPFQFATSHPEGGIWQDISLWRDERSKYAGALPEDLADFSRRLARMGITPETRVLVVGDRGAELAKAGRLAWILRLVGVPRVYPMSISYLPLKMTAKATEVPASVPWWDPPVLKDGRRVSPAELRDLVRPAPRSQRASGPRAGSGTSEFSSQAYRLIDVRPEEDYLGRVGFGRSRRVPELGAINIPWTDFITVDGRPQGDIRGRLEAVGIQKNHRLVLLSAQGYEAAMATVALEDMGFEHVGIVAGGWEEVLGEWSKKRNR